MTRAAIKMYLATLLLCLFVLQINARDVDFCFADEDEPYLNFATKTAYHFVRSGKSRFQTVLNCQPQQIWMLAVHGTRYPDINEINESTLMELQHHITHNHENRGNGHMCNRDLDNLRRWKPDPHLTTNRAEVLTPQGVEDMKLLARRLQSNFPELLQPEPMYISPRNYKFKSTDARLSMEAFMEGLFGSRHAVLPEQSSVNDTLLSTHKFCNSWDEEQNNATEINEVMQFDVTPQFENLVRNVSRRLGFLYNISASSILAMYDMCRYEKAWSVTQLSPWCAIFSKEELRILEYREDLHYYYHAGYGRHINAGLGCPLLQNMMQHFWNVGTGEATDEPSGIFYFTDVVSLLNLLTTMGIAEDRTQLTAFNYNELAKRQWRTSFISSFAANLVAVFHKCDDSRQPYKVMFYLAEKPVLLDGCEVGLCDWEFLRNKYGDIASNCRLNVCGQSNAISLYIVNHIVFVFTCLFLVSLIY